MDLKIQNGLIGVFFKERLNQIPAVQKLFCRILTMRPEKVQYDFMSQPFMVDMLTIMFGRTDHPIKAA
jgi:hypothetical protein